MDVELGLTQLIIVLIFFIALPVVNSIVFYKLGKKAGYNKAKMEEMGKRDF